jgi:7-keto-8-aminopelargonate synthetase-like enzyme
MKKFPEPLQQIDRTFVLWRGRKLSYFGGCDYLRLSSHPKVLRAAHKGIEKFGLNVAASRRTTGNHKLYEQLESEMAKFFGAESALLTSGGYLTNIIAAQGLKGRFQHAFIDERAHSSLQDALKFLGCAHSSYRHRDSSDLKKKLRHIGRGKSIVVMTDGVFANDGSIAPLVEYRKLFGAAGVLWVDDAHAAGVLGKHGRGSLEAAGLTRKNVIQTITLSKAFGTFGGAILCDEKMGEAIVRESGMFAGNTPTPLPLVNASLAALALAKVHPEMREALWRNVRELREAIGDWPGSIAPILPIVTKNPAGLKRELLREEIHPPLIQYAGGPSGGYFRFAVSSEHTRSQISKLAQVLRKHLGKEGNT